MREEVVRVIDLVGISRDNISRIDIIPWRKEGFGRHGEAGGQRKRSAVSALSRNGGKSERKDELELQYFLIWI